MPWDDHRLLLAMKINILYGWLYCKDSLWHTIIHEGVIINTILTPPFWYYGRCDQNIQNWCRPFSSFCGAATVPVKAIMPRHTFVGIIIIHYSEISLHWLLQEYGKGGELCWNLIPDSLDQVESQIYSNTIYYFEFQTWNLALQPA